MGRYAQLVIGPAGSGKVKDQTAEAGKAKHQLLVSSLFVFAVYLL